MRVNLPEGSNSLELCDLFILSNVRLGHVGLLLLVVFLLLNHGPDSILVLELGFLRNASRALRLAGRHRLILEIVLLVSLNHLKAPFVVCVQYVYSRFY